MRLESVHSTSGGYGSLPMTLEASTHFYSDYGRDIASESRPLLSLHEIPLHMLDLWCFGISEPYIFTRVP